MVFLAVTAVIAAVGVAGSAKAENGLWKQDYLDYTGCSMAAGSAQM